MTEPVFTIHSTAERPDLVPVTARWRWGEFMQDSGRSLEHVLEAAQQTASVASVIPQTLVLLLDGEPVGTASLTAHDLEERPELTPWLAGVVVDPRFRGRGYVTRLIGAVEARARTASIGTLWLYTRRAEPIYARAGWRTVETVLHGGKPYALMRHDLR